jgi:demethylmenaquinone methyltransferase/2-methoxy-6-polyprenyl-1,4-benzoquinol methylase
MSTYVYMRILESAPQRYDLGLRLLSLGRIDAVYEAAAAAVLEAGSSPRVLEIGCGTGNLTAALLKRGATVTAVDQNPDMLAIAAEKLGKEHNELDLREMAAVEIADRFPAGSFDAVAASLVLSEMSEDEQRFVLAAALQVLHPGGRLVAVDEVLPHGLLARCAHACVRWPLAALTYLLTQTTTFAVRDLGAKVRAAGFHVVEERRLRGSDGMVIGEKPRKEVA